MHISQIANERVNAVADYLKEGQKVRVKVLEADEKGRVRLSMKAVTVEEGGMAFGTVGTCCDGSPSASTVIGNMQQ